MNIFTTKHYEDANYAIRLVIDFKPISEEDAERMVPLLKRANGKYGFTAGMLKGALAEGRKKQ